MLLEKLAGVENRYEELNRLIAGHSGGDYSKIAEYSKERAVLEEIVAKFNEYKSCVERFRRSAENVGDS